MPLLGYAEFLGSDDEVLGLQRVGTTGLCEGVDLVLRLSTHVAEVIEDTLEHWLPTVGGRKKPFDVFHDKNGRQKR